MQTSETVKKPFLKWAGSKTRLIRSLKEYLPPGKHRYIEPFVGSGAAFLNTDYPKSVLCDSNPDLIDLFNVLKADTVNFIRACNQLFIAENNREERYYQLRAEFNRSEPGERRASLFLYLNRHCYNGLCRYNSRGQFNTPFGRYERPYFPREEMFAFAERLQSAELKRQDFKTTFADVREHDVVYCDPPYVPLSKTAYFTGYAAGGFSAEHQEELARLSNDAARRGAVVLVSNHDTLVTRKLYSGATLRVPVVVQRSISCDGENRIKTKELIAVFCCGPYVLSPEKHFSNIKKDVKPLSNTIQRWLLDNDYEDVAEKIGKVIAAWEKQGKRTRRNWWDVLAGDTRGNPQCIEGVTFPVLRAARIRKGLKMTPGCLCRNEKEQIPKIARWADRK
jgi:DNA adenine methylase